MATASGSQPCIQQNCSGCNKPSFSDGTTVACYQCHRWYHDACAGGAVADGSWACVACVLSMSGPAKSIISTSSTRSARVRLELLRLEEVQKVKEKHMLERQEQERLREERTQKEKEDLAQKFIDEKFTLLMSETLEDGASSVRSRGSRQRSVDKVNTWMEAGNQETSAADIAFDNSVVSLSQPPARMQNLLQGTPLSSLGAKVVSCTSVTQTLVPPSTPIAIQSTMSLRNVPPGLPATAMVPRSAMPDLAFHQTTSSRMKTNATSAALSTVQPPLVSTWMEPPVGSVLPSVPDQRHSNGQPLLQSHPMYEDRSQHVPSVQPHQPHVDQSRPALPNAAYNGVPGPFLGQYQQQMAARQVVPRELPIFAGNPEDWPLFISSYRNSTLMCGYTDAENLKRLQKCLRGNALEVVRSNLLLPLSVPQVMASGHWPHWRYFSATQNGLFSLC